MGGDITNKTISNLRYQTYTGGKLHIHDDAKRLKFVADAKTFKKDVEEALKDLKAAKGGAAQILGTSVEVVYLIQDGGKTFVVVAKDSDEKELVNFVKGL